MKRLFCSLVIVCMVCFCASGATLTSCGPGYILTNHTKIEGINTVECKKLWCRDLETGQPMGTGDTPNSGYQNTSSSVELCDAQNNCIECFGTRRWCSGEVEGQWNPEYGAYTRGGDNNTFTSQRKGSCFTWRLEKPECPNGETAILQGDRWVCGTSSGTSEASRASSVRRTGTFRKLKK